MSWRHPHEGRAGNGPTARAVARARHVLQRRRLAPAEAPAGTVLPGATTVARPRVGLYRYLAKQSLRHQLGLTVLVALLAGLALIPIDMQRRLINQGIGPGRLDALAWYAVAFLFSALLVTTLKFVINLYQAYIAERVLRALRAELYDRIRQFPIGRLESTPPAQLVSVVLAEAGELTEFFSQAFSVPLVSGFTLIAVSFYLATLNPWTLALLALYPIEIWLIPRLQRRVNRFSRSRVVLGRHLSADVVHTLGRRTATDSSANHERADLKRFRRRLDRLFSTRFRAAVFANLIKWVGNAVARAGPFLIFLGGGWLIVTRPGSFDLGSLVATLAAYDRLNEPWQELLDYYSLKEIALTRYAQIMASVASTNGQD
jgi:ABC-type multidrug transport system fused ATPase/permease subunit